MYRRTIKSSCIHTPSIYSWFCFLIDIIVPLIIFIKTWIVQHLMVDRPQLCTVSLQLRGIQVLREPAARGAHLWRSSWRRGFGWLRNDDNIWRYDCRSPNVILHLTRTLVLREISGVGVRHRRSRSAAGGLGGEAVQEEVPVEVRETEWRPVALQGLHKRRVLAGGPAKARERGHQSVAATAVALAHHAARPHPPPTLNGAGRQVARMGSISVSGRSVGRAALFWSSCLCCWCRVARGAGGHRRNGSGNGCFGARQIDGPIVGAPSRCVSSIIYLTSCVSWIIPVSSKQVSTVSYL